MEYPALRKEIMLYFCLLFLYIKKRLETARPVATYQLCKGEKNTSLKFLQIVPYSSLVIKTPLLFHCYFQPFAPEM